MTANVRNETNVIYYGDNFDVLKSLKPGSVNLIYIDPPFNTGRTQSRKQLKTVRDVDGDRKGFKGQTYKTTVVGEKSFQDTYESSKVFRAFLRPLLIHAKKLLTPNGSLYFHIDYRESHYCKVILDGIFGRRSFMNEIIWAYDYGARSKKNWPAKHDTIFWYVKNPKNYIYNYDEIDRVPYMAPGLVGPEKAARGKTPTDVWWQKQLPVELPSSNASDVWWHTIVSPTGKEKTGYPTQKPLGVVKRIITASSNPGDTVLVFFAGSGTTGGAAFQLGRKFILVDSNKQAIDVMKKRLAYVQGLKVIPWK